jgi:hypothetical protein
MAGRAVFYSAGMGRKATNGEKGFHVFAMQAANWVGTKWAFLAALLIIALWLVSGPYFHYSDTWQLIINTGTTVVTLLVVFLIQNTQNRDAQKARLIDLYAGVSASCSGCDEASAAVLLFDAQCY